MNSKLEKLRADFSEVKGKPFVHFYCPILFEDGDVELCKAHVINVKFPDSSRVWTVQRKDVDNFYGSNFETDFVSIQYANEDLTGVVLTDRGLSKQFSPKIFADNEAVDFFIAKNAVSEEFTPVVFENMGKTVTIGLKMPPQTFFQSVEKSWEIGVSKDVRIPALVSLIKAAHLTLFEMLGYRYGLSAAGYFVGRQILGEFFNRNKSQPKATVLDNAIPYFREFAHMVRPISSDNHDFEGTITDGLLHVCIDNRNNPWAFIVYINISRSLYAVMIPVFDKPENVERFMNFLQNELDSIEVSLCHFSQNHWEINKDVMKIIWPKDGILYPETS